MNFIDTHAHLDGIEDVDAKLQQAAEAGVNKVVAVGVDLASNRINFEIKKRCTAPQIFLALGIHPGNIITEQIDETINFICEHKSDIVAIGETGLDFWYPFIKKSEERKQEQIKVFQLQLELAKEFDLPIIVHSRGAWQEAFDMVKNFGVRLVVFHWYSGPTEILKDILDSGYFISATPALAYSPQAQAAITAAPIEQTLIETDSPVFYRTGKDEGFKASPKDVFRTLEAYAKLKNVDKEKAAAVLNQNAEKVFKI
jgi:TatD DNase family protein